MPVRIVRAHDDSGYYVEDIHSRKRHSDSPMTLENAERQMRILNRVYSLQHPHHSPAPAHKWISEIHMKKGAFTAQAKRHHETVPEFEREVLESPEKFQSKTVKRARLAETLAHLRK